MTSGVEVPPADRDQRERGLSYAQRLGNRCDRRGSVLCAGLDPTPDAIRLLSPEGLDSRAAHAAAIERFCALVIEAVRDHAVAVKLQAAWFELAGWHGMRALERAAAYAHTAGLLVVVDAKRGDVPHSARGYATAWLDQPFETAAHCDALTVNVSIGSDALAAMCEVAHPRGCQVYALVHTSNPGAAAFQGVQLASGGSWWELLARAVADAGAGAVVGATRPEVVRRARELMPDAPLLLPGVGAQGAAAEDLRDAASATAPPPLVAVSRSLLPPGAADAGAFRQHVSEAARELCSATAFLARPSAR